MPHETLMRLQSRVTLNLEKYKQMAKDTGRAVRLPSKVDLTRIKGEVIEFISETHAKVRWPGLQDLILPLTALRPA